MSRKVPSDAFSEYVAMGASRSYQGLANRYGVSKRTITKLAVKESWSERLVKIESEAREKTDRKLVETVEEMNDRHIKTLRAIQGKALKALASMPLTKGMEAVRALEMTIRQERLIRGDPTDREGSVEEITKREIGRWLIVGDDDDEREPS